MKINKMILLALTIFVAGTNQLMIANVRIANKTNETIKVRFRCKTKAHDKLSQKQQFSIKPNTILPIIMNNAQFANCNQIEILTHDAGWYPLANHFKANKADAANTLIIGQAKQPISRPKKAVAQPKKAVAQPKKVISKPKK